MHFVDIGQHILAQILDLPVVGFVPHQKGALLRDPVILKILVLHITCEHSREFDSRHR